MSNSIKLGQRLYSYDYSLSTTGLHLHCNEWQVIRMTPKGYWVLSDWYIKIWGAFDDMDEETQAAAMIMAKFARNKARRSRYLPTKEEALRDFKRRQEWRVGRLTQEMDLARRLASKAEFELRTTAEEKTG